MRMILERLNTALQCITVQLRVAVLCLNAGIRFYSMWRIVNYLLKEKRRGNWKLAS
jgi:hypothetical protein